MADDWRTRLDYRPNTVGGGASQTSRGGNHLQRAYTRGTTIGKGNLPSTMGQATNAGNLQNLLNNSGAENPYGDPTTTPPPPGPGGSPSGGGYGGGGGQSAKAQALKMSQGLQALLASGRFGARDVSGDTARINSGVSADQASRQAAYQALTDTINNQANPYRDVELTQARTLDPRLAAMLRSQGGDVGAYEAELGLANTLAGQGADADQRFLRSIAAGRDAQKADSLQATAEASEYGRGEIAAAGTAAKAALAEKARLENKAKQDQQMQIILQLIQANASAGVDTDLSKYGLG